MTLYVGTSGYSYTEWKGPFYPEELPEKRMLSYYGGQFKSVEAPAGKEVPGVGSRVRWVPARGGIG